MRSTRDCRPIVLCSEMLGDGRSLNALRLSGLIALSLLEGVCLREGGVNDGRDGLTVGDRSGVGDGVARNDGAGALGATEVLGRLGLTEGAGRKAGGLGRLGVIEGLGLGEAGCCRLDMRFSTPPLGLGAL